MNKSLTTLTLAAVLTLTLTACGDTASDNCEASTQTQDITTMQMGERISGGTSGGSRGGMTGGVRGGSGGNKSGSGKSKGSSSAGVGVAAGVGLTRDDDDCDDD